ncbi:unnamed protein product [Pelagomonas calceolata]|uniref:MYND-type domain-containing protein n=2 Tax=Pelagomonas calceolata TaxID=35677 RepID=A0A8J2SLF4_9STRA|nr:unnamed protein product [Pelagomonas calceolata]
MILTKCAVCATELGLSLGKKCGRCSTRYCGAECQKQHWESGGHDTLCKKIKKAGGAEQYNANEKYTAAVAVAAEACAADTKGQTCYICTQALHWKTKEGLVRMCACRGTAGFAHLSCLAEQAKLLNDEGEENNLSPEGRWRRWVTCSLCKQDYHGVVQCALGWACWKTYVGRPKTCRPRVWAMTVLGNGLGEAEQDEDALVVQEAELSTKRRVGESEYNILVAQSNLAITYENLERLDEALRLKRDVYTGFLKLFGEEHEQTLRAVNNYATSLVRLERFGEAKSLLRKTVHMVRRVLGESDETTLRFRSSYAAALCQDDCATLGDLREAMTTLEDAGRIARRVLGGAHPLTGAIERHLEWSRAALAAREDTKIK